MPVQSRKDRQNQHRNAAADMLWIIQCANRQAMRNVVCDADGDGIGEALSIDMLCREYSITQLKPTVNPGVFMVGDSGYYLSYHLPDKAHDREKIWCAFAWGPAGEGGVVNCYMTDGATGSVFVWADAPFRLQSLIPHLEDVYESSPSCSSVKPVWRVVRSRDGRSLR